MSAKALEITQEHLPSTKCKVHLRLIIFLANPGGRGSFLGNPGRREGLVLQEIWLGGGLKNMPISRVCVDFFLE